MLVLTDYFGQIEKKIRLLLNKLPILPKYLDDIHIDGSFVYILSIKSHVLRENNHQYYNNIRIEWLLKKGKY